MPHVVGEYIDQICSIELRPRDGNIPRGVTRNLYDAARSKVDGPLSQRMAEALLERVQPGSRVVIVTGAGGEPYLPTSEIDGLLGAIAIARALHLGRNADVHILVEPHVVDAISKVAVAGELSAVEHGERRLPHSVVVHATPIAEDECEPYSVALLDELQPDAIIAIEKLSEAEDGIIHGSTGLSWHDVHFKPRFIFAHARERGILTCGIGDCGNEVGFGSIPEVREIMPAGDTMASAVSTDHLLVAGVSNWGGYAIAGMVGLILERPEIMCSPDIVDRMMRAAVAAGCMNGLFNRPMLTDDGIPLDAHMALAKLVETAVTQALLKNAVSPGH